VYEIPLLPFVTPEGLENIPSTDAIVDHLFEMHSAVITPRVIARRQIWRLVERVVSKAKESSPLKLVKKIVEHEQPARRFDDAKQQHDKDWDRSESEESDAAPQHAFLTGD
jgi:hypothetical protein